MDSKEKRRLVWNSISTLQVNGRYGELKKYKHHGRYTLYEHCIRVAIISLDIADKLGISIDRQKLIYGALLHDYFLYDWHKRGNRPPFTHGFTHPRVALQNAQRDYMLSYTEKDIIKRHMFPLMFIPPRTKEGWIVCIVDKVSTLCEIFDNKTGSK